MKLEYLCFFIDHLGYSEVVRKISNDKDAEKFSRRMRENANRLKATNSTAQQLSYRLMENEGGFNLYRHYKIDYVFISDSIFITFTPLNIPEIPEPHRLSHSANAIFIAALRLIEYTTSCITDGFFVRGGASNLYAKTDGSKIIGPGGVEAAELEKNSAIYPRIVLSKGIQNNAALKAKIDFLQDSMYGGIKIIDLDEDGLLYINFHAYLLALGSTKSQAVKAAEDQGRRVVTINQTLFLMYLDAEEKELKNQLEQIKANIDQHERTCLKICRKYDWLVNKRNAAIKDDDLFKKYQLKNEFKSIIDERTSRASSTVQ